MIRSMMRAGLFSMLVAAGAVSLSHAADPAPAKKPPYPLKTCVVSGEKLDSMNEEKSIMYEGREVRFCCPGCEKDFRKEPAKYIKMIDDAAKAAAATQPSKPASK